MGAAIESVALQRYGDIELVAVEDASTDGSLDAIRRALAAAPWLPARVIARGENGGLPNARNLAIEQARGEYVFILDADNTLYPHAIERLVEALDGDPGAAYAYGILEQFDPSKGPHDLMSWLAWSRSRFSYGNYVDAMALIRRDVLTEVGGYTTDMRLHGWEDYALWCALADRGHRALQVPEILARYRTSRHSMVSVTNVDAEEAFAVLHDRYAFLDQALA